MTVHAFAFGVRAVSLKSYSRSSHVPVLYKPLVYPSEILVPAQHELARVSRGGYVFFLIEDPKNYSYNMVSVHTATQQQLAAAQTPHHLED
jgi:hypothetical protein